MHPTVTTQTSSGYQFDANIALYLAGLIAVIPPLQPTHNLPYTSFYSEWLAFVLGVGACFPFTTKRFWEDFSVPRVTLPLLGLVVFFAFQHFVVQHAYPSQALVPVLYVVWTMLLIVIAFWLKARLGLEYVLRVLASFLLFGGVLHALIGFVQYLEMPGLLAAWIDYHPPGSALSGNVGQANHFATQLTLSGTALIYLYAANRLSFALALLLLAVMVFALTLTASRSVFLYFVAIQIFSLFGYYQTRESTYRRFSIMAAAFVVGLLLAQYLLPPFGSWLNHALIDLGFRNTNVGLLTAFEKTQFTGGIELRLSEWHKAWLMVLQSPIWGVGLGNYGWHSFTYQALPQFSPLDKPELFHHSHNLFTQFAAESGIVGLGLLCVVIWVWLKQYLTVWQTPASWLIGAGLLVLFIHSNLEYPLWYSYFLGIAALLIGVGANDAIKIKFTPALGRLASGIALSLVALLLFATYRGYQTLAAANQLIFTTTPEEAARVIHAISLNPLLTPVAEQLMATHGIADKSIVARQLALTTRVMRNHPNPIKVGRQIEYLAIADHAGDAISLLKVAARAYPVHIPAYICRWHSMEIHEIRPLEEYARRLVQEPVGCGTNERNTFNALEEIATMRG